MEQVLRGKFSSLVCVPFWNVHIMPRSCLSPDSYMPCCGLATEGNLAENSQMPLWTLKTVEAQGKSPRFKAGDDWDSKHSRIKGVAMLWNPVYLSGCS